LISNNKDKILAANILLTQLIDYLKWTNQRGKYAFKNNNGNGDDDDDNEIMEEDQLMRDN